MIAWLALAVALVDLVLWLIVAWTLRRVWATIGPQVQPLLAMFAPQQTPADPAAAIPEPDGLL